MRDGTFSVDGAAVGSTDWPSGRSDGSAPGPSVRWRGSDDQVATPSGVRQDPAPRRGKGLRPSGECKLTVTDEAVASPSGAVPHPAGRETMWSSGHDVEGPGRSSPGSDRTARASSEVFGRRERRGRHDPDQPIVGGHGRPRCPRAWWVAVRSAVDRERNSPKRRAFGRGGPGTGGNFARGCCRQLPEPERKMALATRSRRPGTSTARSDRKLNPLLAGVGSETGSWGVGGVLSGTRR